MFGWFGLVGYVCGYFRLDLLLSLLGTSAGGGRFVRANLIVVIGHLLLAALFRA
jgi:hypothetical protein